MRRCLKALAGSALVMTVMVRNDGAAQTPRELRRKAGGGLFAPMWRTAACTLTKKPRWPSVETTADGDLLLLLTCDTADAPGAALCLTRSRDDGRTWSEPRAIHQSAGAEPRACGTLTRLKSGQLLAPFAEPVGALRLLASDDQGESWAVAGPIDCTPLLNAVPYSRIVETGDELLMPVFGTLQVGQKRLPCSGLMRSTDGAHTWDEFTAIACDRAGPGVAYGATAVAAGADGSLLALISDGSLYTHRSVSRDAGRTWSTPQPRMLSRNPALATVGTILACLSGDTQRRGTVRVQFSENLFDSWRCERLLDDNIKGEHFSAAALDGDRLLLVHDRGTVKPSRDIRGTVVTEGIEVAMMRRNPAAAPAPRPLVPEAARDRWEKARRLTDPFPAEVGSPFLAVGPRAELVAVSGNGVFVSRDRARSYEKTGDLPEEVAESLGQGLNLSYLGVLRSGRLLLACTDDSALKSDPEANWRGTYTRLGRVDGYDRWQLTGVKGTFAIRVFLSDDQGRNWESASRVDAAPLVWAYAQGRFLELDSGTIAMTIYGGLSPEDTGGRIDCCGILRSTDGGATWGDFSRVAYDDAFGEIAYNELDIQPMPDGTWTACIRTEWRTMAGGHPSLGSVAFSRDFGRTWTQPELMFPGSGFDLALLPDGGLVYGLAGLRKVIVSYDGGHTWSLALPARTDTYARLELLNNDNLFVYGGWGGRRGIVYRRVPAATADGARIEAIELRKATGPVASGAVLDVGEPGRFDAEYAGFPTVCYDGALYRMWYSSWDTVWAGPGGIGLVTSADGVHWTRANQGDPVLGVGEKRAFDGGQVLGPCVLRDDGGYMMWYGGMDGSVRAGVGVERIGLAASKDGVNWTRANDGKPVLGLGAPGSYDHLQAAHPCVLRDDGKRYRMWYSAYSAEADHTICVARSSDGVHWERERNGRPVAGLQPTRVTGPAVCRQGDGYLMLFSGYAECWSLYAAVSRDGIKWRMLADGKPVLPLGPASAFDSRQMHHPSLLQVDERLRVWYTGDGGGKLRIGLSEATLSAAE